MKKKIHERILTFFGLVLFAGVVALLFLAGVLLMPIVLTVLFFVMIKELIVWKRKRKQWVQQQQMVAMPENGSALHTLSAAEKKEAA